MLDLFFNRRPGTAIKQITITRVFSAGQIAKVWGSWQAGRQRHPERKTLSPCPQTGRPDVTWHYSTITEVCVLVVCLWKHLVDFVVSFSIFLTLSPYLNACVALWMQFWTLVDYSFSLVVHICWATCFSCCLKVICFANWDAVCHLGIIEIIHSVM